MKIVIDPGHGGNDKANRGPTGYIEADGVLDIGLRLRDLLVKAGYEVLMTREADITVSLSERSEIANRWMGDLLISLHTNAADNPTANGIETFYSYNGEWGQIFRSEAARVAEVIQRQLVNQTRLANRGIKTRIVDNTSSSIYGKDYYSIIRKTKMPSLIIEMGFHTNVKEEALLKKSEFRQLLSQSIYEGILELYPITKSVTAISGKPIVGISQAREWLRQKAPEWVHLVEIYYKMGEKYKIRPDIALCQACKETGYFTFKGLVKPWQNNFCGLGATGIASDGNTPLGGADPTKVRFEQGVHGAIFVNTAAGVEAHIQHLFAYSTTEPLPTGTTLLSPRFNLVQRGSAPYVEYLGAAENPKGIGWAYPGVNYGKSIIEDFLSSMEQTVVTPIEQIEIEKRRINISLHDKVIFVDGFLWESAHYVPIRFLEQLGYRVTWDSQNQKIVIEYLKKQE